MFTLIIGDLLDELIALHAIVSPHAIRGKDYWNKEVLSLQSENDTFKERRQRYMLMDPQKRRILYKLLALRIFQGTWIVDI